MGWLVGSGSARFATAAGKPRLESLRFVASSAPCGRFLVSRFECSNYEAIVRAQQREANR